MIILADDLSGAAEVAGLCLRFGRDATLTLDAPPAGAGSNTVLVIDTETRALAPAEAAAAVRRLCPDGVHPRGLFKKTDSVLRGPVRAEIEAVMQSCGARRCLLVPCNPSRGRTIREGIYYVDRVPLGDSEFRLDPTNPARTSRVIDLLGLGDMPVAFAAPGSPVPATGILIGGAGNADDLKAWASRLDETTLAAGAADFLEAILALQGRGADAQVPGLPDGPWLLVSGSRTEASSATLAELVAQSVPVLRVPAGRGGAWPARAVRTTAGEPRSALAVERRRGTATANPEELLAALCAAAAAVVTSRNPAVLLAEGGATAAALARRLNWTRFKVDGELAPGVVLLRPEAAPALRFVVKPGSYPWPPAVLRSFGAGPNAGPIPDALPRP